LEAGKRGAAAIVPEDKLVRGRPFLLSETLRDEQRRLFGSMHPSFMGVEYLPDLYEDEVEIARVELRSTTGDVISIRARPEGNGVAYRVVD